MKWLLLLLPGIVSAFPPARGLHRSSFLTSPAGECRTVRTNRLDNSGLRAVSIEEIDSFIDSLDSEEQEADYNRCIDVIDRLRKDKERRQMELAAVDYAINRAQRKVETIANNATNPNRLMKGTYDYGFVPKTSGSTSLRNKSPTGDAVPASAMVLAWENFQRELSNIFADYVVKNDPKANVTDEVAAKLAHLKLSNDAIWKREKSRPEVEAPLIVKIPYRILCFILDVLFDGQPISRFYFLETVARMPYFSYITMLHTYETLGWWRRSVEAKRVHFAEEFNEYHHLLIWEALGGDQEWRVRFFAQHSAIVYFFGLIFVWVLSPSLAYNFSELIEAHAVDTYAEFADANKEILETLEAPAIAKSYYENPDMYVFDEFQTSRERGSRRPQIYSLYDVVCNIRDDEAEHVATMSSCQDPDVVIRSPNTEAAVIATATAATIAALVFAQYSGVGDIDAVGMGTDAAGDAFSAMIDTVTATGIAAGKALSGETEEISTAKVAAESSTSIFESEIFAKVLRFLSTLRL